MNGIPIHAVLQIRKQKPREVCVSPFAHLLEDPWSRRIFTLKGRSKMEANGRIGRSFAPTWMQGMCRLNLAKGCQREEEEVIGQLCQATHTQPDLTQERTWVAPTLQPLENFLQSLGQHLLGTCSLAGMC